MLSSRRRTWIVPLLGCLLALLYYVRFGNLSNLTSAFLRQPFISKGSAEAVANDGHGESTSHHAHGGTNPFPQPEADDGRFRWSHVKQHYPVTSLASLPSGNPQNLPMIQHHFKQGPSSQPHVQHDRLEAVRGNFTHSWQGYKANAWGKDEGVSWPLCWLPTFRIVWPFVMLADSPDFYKLVRCPVQATTTLVVEQPRSLMG